MAMCEDFPCCGHEQGCCPNFDEFGRQLDMVCTCGARLPVNNRYSICDGCLNSGEDWDGDPERAGEWAEARAEAEWDEDDEYDDE